MSDLIVVEPDRKKWDHSNEFAIVVTCETCGSADVTRDATVRWNQQAQKWELSDTMDHGDCNTCESHRLEDTPLDHWTGDVCVKEEIPSGHFVSAKALADGKYVGVAHDKDGTTLMMLDMDRWNSGPIDSAQEAKDRARAWLNSEGKLG